MRVNISNRNAEMEEFLKKHQSYLAKQEKTCYNSMRNKYIDNITLTKLVYNENTDEWEKLRELQNYDQQTTNGSP